MVSSFDLYGEATAKAARAERCRAVAHALDLRRTAMIERHEPVVALHSDEVWRGRAAAASRTRLQRVIGAELYSLGLDLASASGALRAEAARLESEAAVLRSRARALAESEARQARDSEIVGSSRLWSGP